MEAALGLLALVLFLGVLALEKVPPVQRWLESLVRKIQGAGEPVVGTETLAGATAILTEPTRPGDDANSHVSRIRIGKETWSVRLHKPCAAGTRVQVMRTGTILDVVPLDVS